MLMSISDEKFIDKNIEDKDNPERDNRMKTCTREVMVHFLHRVLDRNKPLFLFNSNPNIDDTFGDAGTPSFSMIALIENN